MCEEALAPHAVGSRHGPTSGNGNLARHGPPRGMGVDTRWARQNKKIVASCMSFGGQCHVHQVLLVVFLCSTFCGSSLGDFVAAFTHPLTQGLLLEALAHPLRLDPRDFG